MITPKRWTLAWICLLLVFFPAAVLTQSISTNCSSPAWSFEELSEKLKVSDDCIEAFAAQWTDNQTAELLHNLRRITEILQKQQKTVCKDATPSECPHPIMHSKGGLVCVSVEGKRYCKPMCNEGYDFSFLRRSRPYEECSSDTNHKWTTQYVGGNRLAICNKSNAKVAGSPSAYFPKEQDCLKTKSETKLEERVMETFKTELQRGNITGSFTHACLLCG